MARPTVLMLLIALACAACDRTDAPPKAEVPQVALTGRVIDQAEVLNAAEEQQIASLSEALEQRTSDQLVVVTLATLNGASIEQVGFALGNSWGLGRADADNGVLLLIAPKERKVRVEVGTGLEGLLTDARAADVVRNMLPAFQRQAYGRGVIAGATDIVQLLEGDPRRPQPKAVAT